MKRVYTLNINNYFPELTEITIPLMKNYADEIGAEFIEITERKFPDYHIHYEKMQIYELGKDAEWNIFFDADALILNPSMFDVSKLNPNLVFFKDGYSASIKFRMNKYFYNDKRNKGICDCFIATSNKTHNMWEIPELTSDEINSKIITKKENLDKGITSGFYQTEYILSYNLAKYKFNYSGISKEFLYHSYNSNLNEMKLQEIKKIMSDFQ